jgi:hypothetical protein
MSGVLQIVGAALLSPPLWTWPVAAWLTFHASTVGFPPDQAMQYYYMPALGLVLVGCLPSFVGEQPAPRAAALPPPFLSRRLLGCLTVAVLLAATILRLWRLTEWPPYGIGFEEFQIGARGDMGPDWAQNFVTMYTQPGEHTLTAYAISVAYAFLGTGFLQMRAAFIFVSILSPFLFYAVCRKLVSREVSLFALGLFAVSWWQIAAGRVADEIFFPMWVELAVLWLLLHFEDTGRTWAAALMALLSGLLIYEYTSYHLVVIVVIGYLLARVLLFALRVARAPDPRLGRRRQVGQALRIYAPGAIAMLLVWIIIANFQLVGDIRGGMGSWFSGGVGGHANDQDGVLVKLSASPSEMPAFVGRKLLIPIQAAYAPGHGDFCLFLGLGGAPAFDLATAISMGAGFILVALTFWRRFHALALAWAGMVICGAALLPANANLHRYYTGLPLYYLIAALGAEVVWQWLRRPAARYALLGVFAVALAYAAAYNTHELFWRLFPDQTLRTNWTWPRTEVINWVRSHRRSDWTCIVADDERSIYGANPLQPEWKFLLDGYNVRTSPTGSDCIPAPEGGDQARYYIFALAQTPTDLEALLRQSYPDARELAPIVVPHLQFTARTFYVPAHDS